MASTSRNTQQATSMTVRPVGPTSILARFECPFIRNSTCTNGANCPFSGHNLRRSTLTRSRAAITVSRQSILLKLPQFVCSAYLVGKCNNQAQSDICPNGYHVKNFGQLQKADSLQRLYNTKKAKIEAPNSTPARNKKARTAKTPEVIEISPENHQSPPQAKKFIITCAICLEDIDSSPKSEPLLVALQENCPHVFCSSCLTTLREHQLRVNPVGRDFQPTCPMCRVPSKYSILAQRIPETVEEKTQLFEAHKKLDMLNIHSMDVNFLLQIMRCRVHATMQQYS